MTEEYKISLLVSIQASGWVCRPRQKLFLVPKMFFLQRTE